MVCLWDADGIGWGPGLTRELARWIVHGAADISMRAFDPRRFGSYADKDWQVIKAKEDYCLRHEIPFPHFNRLAGHRPWALRLSYAGELGWELHGPRGGMLAVYDALWGAGDAHGIADDGSFAMNAMRLERASKGRVSLPMR